MQYRTLESEVNSLNAEVTRLRIMVNRCVESQDNARQTQLVVHQPPNIQPNGNQPPSADRLHAVHAALASDTKLPLPNEPMSVLPTIFSGMDGTARLFKVLIETYPWLLPSDLRQAQLDLEHEAALAAQHRKRKDNKKRSSHKRHYSSSASSSSSDSESMSESSSTDEEEILRRHKEKKSQKGKNNKTASNKSEKAPKKVADDEIQKPESRGDRKHQSDDNVAASQGNTPRAQTPTIAYSAPKRTGMSPSADTLTVNHATTPNVASKIGTKPASEDTDSPSAVQGLLNQRSSTVKKKPSYLNRFTRDSDEEEADIALANTRTSKPSETPRVTSPVTASASVVTAKRRNSTDSVNSYNSFVDETQKPKPNVDDTLNF